MTKINKALENLFSEGKINMEGRLHNDDAKDYIKAIDCSSHWSKAGVVIVLDKRDCMLSDGTIKPMREVFANAKSTDNRRIGIKKYDIVSFRNCIVGDAFIASNVAINAGTAPKAGIVAKIEDGIATVYNGETVLKVPTVALNKRLTSMSKKMYDLYKYAIDAGKRPTISEDMFYMSVDEEYVEYITPNRLEKFNGDFWNKELRQKLATRKKIRATLKKLLGLEVDAIELLIQTHISKTEFEILSGEDIKECFNSASIIKKGSLGSSCMMDKPHEWFNVYADTCEAVVLRINGKITVRALLWTLKKDGGKTIKLLDRIYSSDTKLEPILKGWADRKGYARLESQSYGQTTAIYKGEVISLADYYAKLIKDYESFPYIDTMCVRMGRRLYAGVAHFHHRTGGTSTTRRIGD